VAALPWRRIGKNFRFCQLRLGDKQRETTLFFIKAGGSVPHHRHRGDEITVILKGSFSDHEDKYNVGDFIVRTSGESHRPVASQDQDCLCLSTLDAPIVMSNWLVRAVVAWLNWRALRQQQLLSA
jgi:putative transcriptional regulator